MTDYKMPSEYEEVPNETVTTNAPRDAELAALRQTIAEKDGEIEKLRKDLAETKHSLEAWVSELDDRTMVKQAEIIANDHYRLAAALRTDLSTARAESISSALQVEEMRKAVLANHEWHQEYDEYGGYPDSELYNINCAALSSPPSATLAQVRSALERSIPVLQDYVSKNPKHEYRGVIQDPNGAHAILTAVKSALALIGGTTS